MNKVSILLIDNPDANTTKIDVALREAGIDYTLYFANSGKNGLDILMGDPYHEMIAPDAVKIKPSLVILSKELRDITAFEFLSIVRNYYSLRDRKFLLLSDSLTEAERLAYDKFGVTAYLQRPLDKQQVAKQVKPLLNARHTHFAFMPLIFRTKTKLTAFVKGKIISTGVGAKLATVCLVSALMTSSATIYIKNSWAHEDLAADASKTPEQPVSPAITDEPVAEPALPLPQKQAVKKKVTAAPSHKDLVDTLPHKTESALPKPEALRIVAIEMPDSIAD